MLFRINSNIVQKSCRGILFCNFSKRHSSVSNDPVFYEKLSGLKLKPSESQRQEDIANLRHVFNSHSLSCEEVLKEHFGFNDITSQKILSEHKSLRRKNLSFISLNLKLLKQVIPNPMNFEDEVDEWLRVSRLPSAMLHHRIGMMQEIGLPITFESIMKHRDICTLSLSELSENGMIKDDFIMSTFESLNAPEDVLEKLPSLHQNLDSSLVDLWYSLTRIFLEWKINMNQASFEKLIRRKYYFLHRSFRMQAEVISLLKKNFEFDDTKFCSHSYLLATIPAVIREYIEYGKPISGYTVKSIICMLPSVVRKPLKDTLQTEALLNFITLRLRYATTSLSLFTYPPSTIISRVEYFVNKTSLADFRLSPNSPLLLFYFKRSKMKLESLEAKNGPVEFLPSPVLLFHTNISCLVKVKRAFYVQFLRIVLNVDKSTTYFALSQIHMIHYPDFEDIKKNLIFLLNEDFSMEHIKGAFHLLLYPHSLLTRCYTHELYDSKYGQEFLDQKDFDKLLQLLLYKVNKSYVILGGAYV